MLARLIAPFFIIAAAVGCGGASQNNEAPGADATPAEAPASKADDVVILGGTVYTGLAEQAPTEAVWVSDGRIAMVGSEDAVRAAAGAAPRVIDLEGGALYPGFVDAHAHLIGVGMRELSLNLEGVASIAALAAAVAGAVEDAAPGEVVDGRGWIETGWPEGRFPTRADIDPASPNNPVVLVRADGHALLANSAALARAGVDRDTPAPDGGRIEKDASGEPTGLMIDAAMGLVEGLVATPSLERRREAYAEASRVYAAYGWTGLHNMSVEPADADLIGAMAEEGAVRIRVYNAINGDGLASLAESGPRIAADGRVVTRAVKLYVDGALGSRGATLDAPYADAPNTDGLLLITEEDAKTAYETALRKGVQIATHAIGDRGNRLVLNWYEDIFAAVPAAARAEPEPRWRIEHAQILHVEDIPRFAELGVVASMQPSHAIGDLFFAPARLGVRRLDGAYAWASLLAADALVAGGSDAPVERGDPLIEFYAAVARRSLKGYADENWRPSEAISREAALALFTQAPAYAAFQEDELGAIEVGKRADLTAFSADIMTIPLAEILDAKAILTMVDGEVVFSALGD